MKMIRPKSLNTRKIPIEIDFVRACARMEMTDAWSSWIRVLLQANPDWRKVQMFASHHRVLPLVYRTFHTHFRKQIPEEVMVELSSVYHASVVRNLFMTNELYKVMDWLQFEGIDAIPIKGPVLAKCMYGDIAYRQYDDLDLLIRERDVVAASNLLTSKGYSPNDATVGSAVSNILKHEGECGFDSPHDRVHLDLHWQMVPRVFLEIDHEGLWERSEIVSVDGRPVRVFSPEDTLILLCIHGMRHLWARHIWICDVTQLIRVKPEMDWDEVFNRSRPIQVERVVNIGLILAREYEDLKLPEWVSNQIRADRTAINLVEELRHSPIFHFPHDASLIRLLLMNTFAREGSINKIRYFLGQIFSPSKKDWALIRMSEQMSFLYNVLRPIRILRTYGIKPVARLLASFFGIHS